MKLLIVPLFALLLLVPVPAYALCDDWHTSDTVLGITWTALLLEDWAQTRQAQSRETTVTNQCAQQRDLTTVCIHTATSAFEANPILGKNPSAATVNLYMGAALAGGWAIGCYLPHDSRIVWFAFLSAFEFAVVSNNDRNGFRGFGLSLPLLRF